MPSYDELSKASKAVYNRAICRTHRRRVELHILTLDGKVVQSFTPHVLNGQVTIDVTQTPTRILTITLLDRSRGLIFEPRSADAYPLHRQYKVRVVDSRYVADLGEWVDCIVFTGPIWDFARKGVEVTLTAHGEEQLAMGTVRKPKMWRRKTRKTTIIRGLLAEAGATRMRIPDLKATTAVHVHVGVSKGPKGAQHKVKHVRGFKVTRTQTYWSRAVRLAASLDRHLFADAEGVFVLRSHPERPVYRFGHALLSDVDLHRPAEDGPNTWLVKGAKPKGRKHQVSSGEIGFPAGHPLSADRLAWHGKRAVILDETHNPHLKTKAECRKVGIRKRDRAARVLAEVSFDALPIPWLREYDMVTVAANWGVPTVLMLQWTLPLTPDNSPMTVGTKRRTTPHKADKRWHGHRRVS